MTVTLMHWSNIFDMRKYLILQLKLLAKLMPFVLVVAAILLSALLMIYNGVTQFVKDDEKNKVFRIGITGEMDHPMFQMGLTALETLDSTRFTIEMVQLEESEAQEMLLSGTLTAYVVFPEDFLESALYGEFKPLSFVTIGESAGLVTLVKQEFTRVVEQILVCEQKGVFGLDEALRSEGLESLSYTHINRLNLQYLSLLLNRTETYRVEQIGVQGGADFFQSLLCGLSTLFLMLICLPCAVVFAKRDISLNKVLSGQGLCVTRQAIAEYLACALSALCVVLVSCGVLALFPSLAADIEVRPHTLLVSLTVVSASLSALSYLIFQLCSDVVVGVLAHFFTTLALGYITGCFYPISALPQNIQAAAAFLPTAAARQCLANALTWETGMGTYIAVIGYAAGFLTLAVCVKRYRVLKKGVAS